MVNLYFVFGLRCFTCSPRSARPWHFDMHSSALAAGTRVDHDIAKYKAFWRCNLRTESLKLKFAQARAK